MSENSEDHDHTTREEGAGSGSRSANPFNNDDKLVAMLSSGNSFLSHAGHQHTNNLSLLRSTPQLAASQHVVNLSHYNDELTRERLVLGSQNGPTDIVADAFAATTDTTRSACFGNRATSNSDTSKKPQHTPKKKRSSSSALSSEIDMNLPFPVKLHYILSNPCFRSCITWLDHGRAWRVTKAKVFEKEVIPRFFRSSKYASFMRQVNGWAFSRMTQGPDMNAYYHELFLRGLPHLSFRMKRPSSKTGAGSTTDCSSSHVKGIPNFQSISRIAPLPEAKPFRPVALYSSRLPPNDVDWSERFAIEPLQHSNNTIFDIGAAVSTLFSENSADPLLQNDDSEGKSSAATATIEHEAEILDHYDDDPLLCGAANSSTPSAYKVSSSSSSPKRIQDDPSRSDATTDQQLTQTDIGYLIHQNRFLLQCVVEQDKHKSRRDHGDEEEEQEHHSF